MINKKIILKIRQKFTIKTKKSETGRICLFRLVDNISEITGKQFRKCLPNVFEIYITIYSVGVMNDVIMMSHDRISQIFLFSTCI